MRVHSPYTPAGAFQFLLLALLLTLLGAILYLAQFTNAALL